MQRGAPSERSPLVQPTYVFESSVARQYRKRLRNFQCAICVSIMMILSVALLVTVGYDLNDQLSPDNSSTEAPIPETIIPASQNLSAAQRLTMTLSRPPDSAPVVKTADLAPDLKPLLNKTWPLTERPPSSRSWFTSLEEIHEAVAEGESALAARRAVEKERAPLAKDSPANRAQRAAATASGVKLMADDAYVIEHATGTLTKGYIESMKRKAEKEGESFSLDSGPPTRTFVPRPPPYCSDSPEPEPCSPSRYRSADGSCNHLASPKLAGVANTPFRRVLPAAYADYISAPRAGASGARLPSARAVSVTVHRPSYAHDSQFTVMLAVWGQFVDHDITATALSKGENSSALSCCDPAQPKHPECFPVLLDEADPFYQRYNLTCMEFVRSAPAPRCHFGPREQLNQATAYIDASTVYGTSVAKTEHLRAFAGGRLRMIRVGSQELLPPAKDPDDGCNTAEMAAKGRYCFDSGDDRANENLHLTTMHLLWARQHNRVAAELARANPRWGDAALFHEARRVVGAQMQHIMYSEFLPNVLGSDVMWALNLTVQSSGYAAVYDPEVDATVANHFSAAAFRFAHTLLPGLIHSQELANGSVSYTHLHEMLFNPYQLYAEEGSARSVRSAVNTPVHGVDPHVTDELSNHLFERPTAANSSAAKPSGPCGLDLVSLNIQRGRDHGLPAYPQWREHCGLSRPKTFEDLKGILNDMSLDRIQKIYESVEDVDLYTGALAEEPRGRLLGPTLTCLLADQFLRLKVGDRYWYESGDPLVRFTPEQLSEIRKTTLAGVICANEGRLGRVQPRVMEALSPTNPLVDCFELPQPSFQPWAEGGDGPGPEGTEHDQ